MQTINNTTNNNPNTGAIFIQNQGANNDNGNDASG